MKKLLCMLPAMLMPFMALSAKTYVVKSPDKAYSLKVTAGEGATIYSLDYNGKTVIHNSPIGILAADGRRIGEGSVSSSENRRTKARSMSLWAKTVGSTTITIS